jgi:hypothetical protein
VIEMFARQQVPKWLVVAAVVMVGARAVSLIVAQDAVPKAISLAAAVIVAAFLLRGSRVAWVLALVASISLLTGPVVLDLSWWLAGTAVIVIAGLLAPSSRIYVWQVQMHRSNA